MAMLDKVISGKVSRPYLVLIYGPDGVGKTTFAADAPKSIFIGKEAGSDSMDVSRFPEPTTYQDIISCIDELRTTEHEYRTLVIDSLDWIEPLVWQAVCKEDGVSSIEKVGGGYGKGYTEANAYWMKMMDRIKMLRDAKSMHVIVIAHSQVKAFNDPSQPVPYDRYQLKLNEKAAGLWREFVDVVGFANYEVYTKTDPTGKKSKAFGDGARKLFTERRPAYDAKNRLNLPSELALSFAEFHARASEGKTEDASKILSHIDELSKLVQDPEVKSKITESVKRASDNPATLTKILNRLRVLTNKE